jgi:hypothetical protein
MKRENYKSGWKHYKKGQQDKAFLVNLHPYAMQQETPQPKMKIGRFRRSKTQIGSTHFGQLTYGTQAGEGILMRSNLGPR